MIGGVDIRDDQDWLNKLSNESDSGDLKIDLLFSKLFKLIRKLKERNNMDDLQQKKAS
jgi:ribosome-associated translation inhibitor RaiA